MKRAFDLVVSLVGLALLLPVLAIAGLAIKLDSPGPVFYASSRVGKDGRLFGLYKLRTMVSGADRMGSSVTRGGDPRITRVGRLLRRAKLDEVPNLINVLRGEMSVVGPRPEVPEWVKLYTTEQLQVLQARPGITGLAQVKYRQEEELLRGASIQERYPLIMQEKLRLDLEYVRLHSLGLDLRIIAETAAAILH